MMFNNIKSFASMVILDFIHNRLEVPTDREIGELICQAFGVDTACLDD